MSIGDGLIESLLGVKIPTEKCNKFILYVSFRKYTLKDLAFHAGMGFRIYVY